MRTDTDKKIIANVKTMRQERDIKQRTLAEMIETSHGFVAKVEDENSHCKYSARHIYLIKKHFNCTYDDIFPPVGPLEP